MKVICNVPLAHLWYKALNRTCGTDHLWETCRPLAWNLQKMNSLTDIFKIPNLRFRATFKEMLLLLLLHNTVLGKLEYIYIYILNILF